MNYPIAELFHSIQGEGTWCGTPMHFIRLAGCNVGRSLPPANGARSAEEATKLSDLLKLHPEHTICTAFDGKEFLCDTDYRKKLDCPVGVLIRDTWEKHICLTGGEPLLHNLQPLLEAATEAGKMVHIETSGTRPISPLTQAMGLSRQAVNQILWVACSPKLGLLSENTDQIDEWKFLVADSFDDDLFLDLLHRIQKEAPRNWKAPRIYFQPINGVMEIDRESLAHCFQLLKQYPECHLSVQMHKLLGLR